MTFAHDYEPPLILSQPLWCTPALSEVIELRGQREQPINIEVKLIRHVKRY